MSSRQYEEFFFLKPERMWNLKRKKNDIIYRSGCIQNFEHALLSINFDLLPVAILDGWIVFFYENPLYKLHCERWFANTTATQYDNFIFTHFWFYLISWLVFYLTNKKNNFKKCFFDTAHSVFCCFFLNLLTPVNIQWIILSVMV